MRSILLAKHSNNQRGRRGTGVRKKVNLTAKVPADQLHLLRNSSNKCELIKSLYTAISTIQVEEGKQIVTTSDKSMISIGNSTNILNCNLKCYSVRIQENTLRELIFANFVR